MKQNQKLLLLCGDSYQDISLLAAVNEAQKLNAKDGNALVLYLGEEKAITQEAADIVVVSKLKLDALRTTLLSYTGSRLLLVFADKQILNLLFRLEETGFFKEASIMIVGQAANATVLFTNRQINDVSFKSWAIRYRLRHWLVRFEKLSSFLKAFNFLL